MSDAVTQAAEAVRHDARKVYFGIRQNLNVGKQLEAWPCYIVAAAQVANEARGKAYFLKMCVADPAKGMVDHDDTAYFDGEANRHGKLVDQDRLTNYKHNRLGPSSSPRKNHMVDPEYILIRVMQGPDGKYHLEGLCKQGDLSAHPIAKVRVPCRSAAARAERSMPRRGGDDGITFTMSVLHVVCTGYICWLPTPWTRGLGPFFLTLGRAREATQGRRTRRTRTHQGRRHARTRPGGSHHRDSRSVIRAAKGQRRPRELTTSDLSVSLHTMNSFMASTFMVNGQTRTDGRRTGAVGVGGPGQRLWLRVWR